MNFGHIDYSRVDVPADYHCDRCKAHGVKLWRLYQTFLEHQELTCCNCAGRLESRDVSSIDADGRRDFDPMFDANGKVISGGWRTDQIGWRIPAVPTEEGDTYWGYTSVPQAGLEWWRRLPTKVSIEKGLNP
jgi:hypothetical protein